MNIVLDFLSILKYEVKFILLLFLDGLELFVLPDEQRQLLLLQTLVLALDLFRSLEQFLVPFVF